MQGVTCGENMTCMDLIQILERYLSDHDEHITQQTFSSCMCSKERLVQMFILPTKVL